MAMYTNPLYQPSSESIPHREASRLAERVTEVARREIGPMLDVVGYSYFKSTMLPLLAAISRGEDFDLATWSSLISHENVEVSVVDDITGAEKYRISSVFFNTDISIDDVNLKGISVFTDEVKAQANVSETLSQQMMMDIVDSRVIPVTKDEMFSSGVLAIARLNKIFEDHGMATLPDPREYFKRDIMPNVEGAAPAAKEAAAQAVDEADEFDEL